MFVISIGKFVRASPVVCNVPVRVFSYVGFFIGIKTTKETKTMERDMKRRKKKNIRLRLNALVRRSIPDAFKGGTRHSVETSGRRVQRRHEARRRWRSAGSGRELDLAPGKYVCLGAVCYVTSLLGERGGLLKRLVVTSCGASTRTLSTTTTTSTRFPW